MTPNIAVDLDYRYFATTEATFRAPGTNITYKTGYNTHNVMASVVYRLGPPAPPPPIAAPPPPPAPPPVVERRVFLVFFDWDKSTITPDGMRIIQQAAAAYRAGAPVQIQVTGYTDRSGSPGYNQRLSERRANAVADALARLGVPRSRWRSADAARTTTASRPPTACASRRTAASRSCSRSERVIRRPGFRREPGRRRGRRHRCLNARRAGSATGSPATARAAVAAAQYRQRHGRVSRDRAALDRPRSAGSAQRRAASKSCISMRAAQASGRGAAQGTASIFAPTCCGTPISTGWPGQRRYAALLCCNVLEHVRDPGEFARRCAMLVRPGGVIVVTVPRSYPHHADPIDTLYRPTPEEAAALFPRTARLSPPRSSMSGLSVPRRGAAGARGCCCAICCGCRCRFSASRNGAIRC